MTTDSTQDPSWTLLTIAAVERETGIGKDTLRAWERRYGFPAPVRNERGDRAYTWAQVERLRRVNRLIAAGHRPGALMRMSSDALDDLARIDALPAAAPPYSRRASDAPSAPSGTLSIDDCVRVMRDAGSPGLRRWLMQALGAAGLAAFVRDGVAPLCHAIGEAWVAGRIQVFEEHLVTEALQAVLRHALLPLQVSAGSTRPRVLLTTVPGEEHMLGLLMAEALLTLAGASCIQLGAAMPPAEIAAAARAHEADVVALGFSARMATARRLGALSDLRARLDAGTELWAGGSGVAAMRGVSQPGWLALDLDDIESALAAWQAGRSPAAQPSGPALAGAGG